MANQKISELPKLNAVPVGEDVWLVVVHDGQNKKIKLSIALGN